MDTASGIYYLSLSAEDRPDTVTGFKIRIYLTRSENSHLVC